MKTNTIKNFPIKNELNTKDDGDSKKTFVTNKCHEADALVLDTFQFLEYSRQFDLFSNHSISQCVDLLHTLHEKNQIILKKLENNKDLEKCLDDVQYIYDKLLTVFTGYGTLSFSKVILVLFGSKYNKFQENDVKEMTKSKMELIEQYVTPIGLKQLTWSVPSEELGYIDKITDQILKIEEQRHLECMPSTSYNSLHESAHGLRIVIRNENQKKMISLNGLVKNVPIQFLKQNLYVATRVKEIIETYEGIDNSPISQEVFERWVDSLSLKDLLLYSNNDLMKLLNNIQNDVKYVKQNTIDKIIKHFFDMDLISRRKMLIHLILFNSDNEVQYIAYMLYDLMGANDASDGNDNNEQRKIYESFSWKLKQYFKNTMISTIEFTQEALSTGEDSSATLEQKVLLLRANDKVRDKAMAKLKEVKGRADDQATKAKQYLEGLIKIPFGNYRKEPILCKIDNLNEKFSLIKQMCNVEEKKQYTLYEINKYTEEAAKNLEGGFNKEIIARCNTMKKPNLEYVLRSVSEEPYSTKAKAIKTIKSFLEGNNSTLKSIFYENNCQDKSYPLYRSIDVVYKEINNVENEMLKINEYLDDSIYGHEDAKKQILKIVGQWINGEQKGYCFGFEGSPGVGKTSLAKRGLSNCLRDEDGSPRPFSFIALGGSCNGSTLEGHNYTYVNSTWGKVIDVLMECKCMNPIIYIDELDKVSRTEQGREIIGILTHLIDTTQNDEFQDRYFSGVPVDLSKALFIFSYNDPSLIDRILLDRIHRIRFDNLSWKDKMVIVDKFMMPELNEKMGFENTVKLSEEVIKHIIETYTMEPGVRKLKEILFDLFGEINLQLLNYEKEEEILELPIEVKIEDLGTKYLKKYRKMHETMIHKEPSVGTINGMWANALGKGGIIPIEVRFFPSSTFLDLKLTGMQGDVMKESMNVAKTMAWSLLDKKTQKKLIKYFEETKNQGIHIHCPEGAVPKDGPSAGGAITLAIYSLLSDKKIHNEISMTGETNLQGRITAIGGLESKILGSIRAGVRKVLYPVENQEDFDEFEKKYKDVMDLTQYSFHPVDHIKEAIKLAISK